MLKGRRATRLQAQYVSMYSTYLEQPSKSYIQMWPKPDNHAQMHIMNSSCRASHWNLQLKPDTWCKCVWLVFLYHLCTIINNKTFTILRIKWKTCPNKEYHIFNEYFVTNDIVLYKNDGIANNSLKIDAAGCQWYT